jgi:hypothetical protein
VVLAEAVQYSSRRVLWGQGDTPAADEPLRGGSAWLCTARCSSIDRLAFAAMSPNRHLPTPLPELSLWGFRGLPFSVPLLPVSPRAILAAALACAAAAMAAEGGPIRPVALVEAVQYSSRRVLWGQGEKPPARRAIAVYAQAQRAGVSGR